MTLVQFRAAERYDPACGIGGFIIEQYEAFLSWGGWGPAFEIVIGFIRPRFLPIFTRSTHPLLELNSFPKIFLCSTLFPLVALLLEAVL